MNNQQYNLYNQQPRPKQPNENNKLKNSINSSHLSKHNIFIKILEICFLIVFVFGVLEYYSECKEMGCGFQYLALVFLSEVEFSIALLFYLISVIRLKKLDVYDKILLIGLTLIIIILIFVIVKFQLEPFISIPSKFLPN